MKVTKTLKVRVKDKHAAKLRANARTVNFVWNYINELSYRNIRERGNFLSGFDIDKYTTGASKELGLHSQTVQEISKEYTTRRKQFKRVKLRWRASGGAKRSLGWVPFKKGAAVWSNGQVRFNKQHIGIFDSYGLSNYAFRSGSFNEDARGRWYFNVVVEVEAKQSEGTDAIGIDLGFKDAATTSQGDVLVGKHYRQLELELAKAQRANKKKRAKAIHAKIRNRRNDDWHKFSRKLVKSAAAIFVGNVSSNAMIKGKGAKSAHDQAWYLLKSMLEYKCTHAGVILEVVDEAYTTQSCSGCGVIPHSSPKGRTGLGIREWTCDECGDSHLRDVNAALNILARGHARLAGGIPCL